MLDTTAIAICIIYYDNYSEINSFLEELEKQVKKNFVVGITINKDSNNEAANLLIDNEDKNYQIYAFYPEKNLGYLNGLFYSYEHIIERYKTLEWVVFCNTDIEIRDTFFFETLNNRQYSSEIYCVAPSVYEKNRGVYENPQYEKRYNLKSLNKRIFIFKRPFLSKLYIQLSQIKAQRNRKVKRASQYVYSAHGSFFMLRNKFLQNINRKYFSLMYSEEAFIAEEVNNLNKKIYYDSELEVIHDESQSTGKLDFHKKSKYISDSLIKIRDRYFI
ncbi:hypothetical protein NRIC_11910 [Enterococcus florum]|uniref:Glycosyl transferase family 2 n=1 Tax=Enterococcus florum TaxID=2480627 RepID=A0A4P5P6C9_9ENTE|nr:hypothetical protein [Enterococcus florum]GCF93300.1 hypothetical protein NRIC_11910 [Enterococcus florum]